MCVSGFYNSVLNHKKAFFKNKINQTEIETHDFATGVFPQNLKMIYINLR